MTDDDKIAEALEKFHQKRNASKSFAAPKAEGRDPTQDVDGITYRVPPGARFDDRMSTLTTSVYTVPVIKGEAIESYSSMDGVRVKDRTSVFSENLIALGGLVYFASQLVNLGDGYFMDKRTRQVWNPNDQAWLTNDDLNSM